MKIRLLGFLICLVLTSSVFSQTWGCPELDYDCQSKAVMKALQADPKNPENYYNMGIVFQRSRRHKEAVESFTMFISIPGIKPELLADGYNNRGISHRALGNLDQAYMDYSKAFELKPTDEKPLVNRANLHAYRLEYNDALADYSRAAVVNPKSAQPYAQRGILHLQMKSYVDALADFGKAIELDPTYPEPYYNRGTHFFQKKEFTKAIPDFEKYVKLAKDPRYIADGYTNLGISLFYVGEKDKAIEAATKAIAATPTEPRTYKLRAMMYRELKKVDLAEADERKATELAAKPVLK